MMKKIIGVWRDFKGFLEGVQNELKKCSWPTRSELVDSTIVVVVSVAIFGVFVGFSDWVIMKLLALIIK